MTKPGSTPTAVPAASVTPGTRSTFLPEPFYSRVAHREKRALGEVFGLRNFGVNLTRLPPGTESSLLHRHSRQDEFIYILEGEPTLVTDRSEVVLSPGMCAGFPAQGVAHQLVNRTDRDVLYLEIGDRTPNDDVNFPRDDLRIALGPDGAWVFTRRNGQPY
jgi:uncharacterized cupin superfamily protein